jgi:hypothetical protein
MSVRTGFALMMLLAAGVAGAAADKRQAPKKSTDKIAEGSPAPPPRKPPLPKKTRPAPPTAGKALGLGCSSGED